MRWTDRRHRSGRASTGLRPARRRPAKRACRRIVRRRGRGALAAMEDGAGAGDPAFLPKLAFRGGDRHQPVVWRSRITPATATQAPAIDRARGRSPSMSIVSGIMAIGVIATTAFAIPAGSWISDHWKQETPSTGPHSVVATSQPEAGRLLARAGGRM